MEKTLQKWFYNISTAYIHLRLSKIGEGKREFSENEKQYIEKIYPYAKKLIWEAKYFKFNALSDGMTQKDIAKSLGIPFQTFRYRFRKEVAEIVNLIALREKFIDLIKTEATND